MTTETWTQDRVEQLRAFVQAGLTCSEIADQIGVTRNAVIGKIHRLGIGTGRPGARRARERLPGARPSRCPGPPRHSQRRLLRLVFAQPPWIPDAAVDPTVVPMGVESAQPRSLLELARNQCRWPINDPRDTDFAFCGNDSITGLSYCAGHARMAYRIPARRRA